ncbi:DUF547 domain-containing protein [uncultured Aquimarina sp.]|uniref:DUF547 domain-containing protein n=1 Tax=uncultured Aquimarina sp. TaxID=575652 RepID=UPI002602A79D|nr:DUF547 domain-containing protein [uncultured Aquimarina sp.]
MKIAFQFAIACILFGCISSNKEPQIISNKVADTSKLDQTKESIESPIADTLVVLKDTINEKITDTILKETPAKAEAIKTEVKKTSKKKENKVIKVRPDHSIWDQLTKKYVSSSGKVNYRGFKSNISKIEEYLTHLQKTYPKKDWTKNEKLAYWFNLYNASTIQLVASSYPVKSIKNINSGKPWDKKFIKSGSKVYSLNQIENTIVRPNFNEPRLHVAFNCAAVSCPKLLKGAFFPSKLNYQLETLSRSWINDTSKNKIGSDKIVISKIFEWYAVDFKKGVIPFINRYAITKANESANIQYLEYNWKLND